MQKDKTFTPHLLVIPTGSTVDFPNLDPFFHNVFSEFNGKRFDLGLYESGSSRTVHFDHDGVSYIFCNIHPEMSAVIVTLSTPYFGVSDGMATSVACRTTCDVRDACLGGGQQHSRSKCSEPPRGREPFAEGSGCG